MVGKVRFPIARDELIDIGGMVGVDALEQVVQMVIGVVRNRVEFPIPEFRPRSGPAE
jgi:hypothetical protein